MLASPAEACRLALVLAMDVSSSVDLAEDRLQRSGLAAALLAPEVQEAFFLSPDPVALQIFEWSGRTYQRDIVGWQMIRTPDDLTAVAAQVAASSRAGGGQQTALGYALGYALQQLQTGPACFARTIDMAGDGPSNAGFSPDAAYATLPFDGVIVNGLVIDDGAIDVQSYYEQRVRRGPGSFVEVARGFAEFETTMRRKLVRELSTQVIGHAIETDERRG